MSIRQTFFCWTSLCLKATVFEVLRTLDRAGSRVAAVVLTGSDNELDYAQVVKLGARGLVLKSDGPEKLFAAIPHRCQLANSLFPMNLPSRYSPP